MKLLWVKAGGLLPPDMGGKIRSYQILKQLARHHEITLFTFYAEHPEDQHLRGNDIFTNLVAVPLPLPPRRSLAEYTRAAGMIATGRPATVYKFITPEVRRRYDELLAHAIPDLIICDFIVPAPLMRWKTAPPTILFTHNVEAQIWERHAKFAADPLMKAASWLESRALARTESRYVKLACHVLTVSENDRNFFLKYVPPACISVIPTGVDTEYFTPASTPEQHGATVFTGSMDYMPNEDGISFFTSEIFPLIRHEIPEVSFWIVGRRPTKRIQDLASANITVTGTVDDIRPYLAKAPVCIVPLRSGSGTRIKIFEAMAMGKAVVSTTLGAEGLPVQHGKNIILADDPADFARAVVQLLRDPARRAELGQAARRLVEQNYSWASVAVTFNDIMQRVVTHA